MNNEQIMQIQMIEQEAQQLNQQLQLIDQNVVEMQELNLGLEELEKKESKEFLASLGKGIYIPVEIKDKKLTVEIGHKHFVKKSIPDTQEVINQQLVKLVSAKSQILERLESLQEEVNMLIQRHDKGEKEEED
jgi:prefoldin alpha subunit